MELISEKMGNITVVTLKTEVLDANNAKTFKEKVAPILKDSKQILIRMDQVSFIDSSGCGALLSCLRKINTTKGILKVSGVQKPVRALFELIRLNRIMDIYGTLDDALKAF